MLGFQDVYPSAIGAELLSDYYQKHQDEFLSEELPRINSECPATVRLIAMEFQELIPNVVEKLCSFEVTAILARKEAAEKTGLSPDQIGICLISPCPAKNTRFYPDSPPPRPKDLHPAFFPRFRHCRPER